MKKEFKMNRLTVIILTICSLAIGQTTDLFLSEYAEGSEGSNKYIEIYNGTGSDIDLSNYQVWGSNNGSDWKVERQHSLSGTLVNGDVYVIAADAASQAILDEADLALAYESAVHYNGDDAVGLAKDNGTGTFELIDVIGVPDNDPGTGWDVAGVVNATKDHTLIRKALVTSGNTDWASSAGTSVDNSEWLVDLPPTNSYTPETLGSHPHVDPSISITSPADGSTLYSSDVTISFDASNFTVGTSGSGDGHIHYALDAGTTVMQYTTDDIALTGLSETSHTFIIWLVDDSHANLSPHVADTVSFTVASLPSATPIENIQTGIVAEGTIVTIMGVVTAGSGETPDGSASFYLQEGTGQYSGINVYSTGFSVNRGDSISVTGTYVEYYGKTEIESVTNITVISTDVTLPTAEVLTLDQTDWEPWEGVLISIENITVADDDAGFGEWKVNVGVDTLVIDNAGNYTYSPTNGDFISSITGPLNYSYSNYKLIPRDNIDIDLTGDSPSISTISLNPTSPTDADDVIVSAIITDNGTIASATLTYDAGSGNIDVTMSNTSSDTYAGTIPAQPSGTTVSFSITAVDNEGNSTTSDESSYLVIPSGGDITAIYDIQYTTDASGDSPLDGQTVSISGIVTAEFWGSSGNKYLNVQDAVGPWNGIVAYNSNGWDTFDFSTTAGVVHSVAEGDSVTVTGTVDEYYCSTCDDGLTEIVDVSEVIIHGPAVNMISPTVVTPGQVMTGGTDAEAYEGCLVKVDSVTVDDPDLGNGEWLVTDGTNSLRVDDIWDYYYFPESGQALAGVAGVMTYTYSDAKLEPRLARDVVEEGVTRIQRINQVLYSDLLKVADDNVSDMSYYMEGDTFTVEGIVTVATGLAYAGTGVKLIFEDYNGGPWSGMVCYSAEPAALGSQPIGRKIRATGLISEYGHDSYDGNVTEIDITQPIQVLGFDPTAVPVDTINTGDIRVPLTAEQWGAVWIEINNAMVIRNDLDYGQWTIDDGSGEIKIGTNSESEEWTGWERPPVGSFVESIRGWVYHRHGYYSDSTAYKLEPNYPSDITFGAGPPIIAEVHREPCVVSPSDQVQVSTMITDNSTISQAFVHFRYDGGVWDSVAMSSPGADDIWSGDIPSSSSDDVFVEYYISAYDDGIDQIEIKSSHFPNIEVGNYMGYISKNGDLTIYDIQYSPWPSGVSPYIDCSVTLTGIVTVDSLDHSTGSYNSYAMQSASAQWSGIFFDGYNLPGLARGDEITTTGKVYEHYGSTNLDSVTAVTIMSTDNVISPLLVSTADLAQDSDEPEAYEGCLVTVSNVDVTSINMSSSGTTVYDWSIKDDSGISCLMDDDMSTMEADNFLSGLEVGSTLETVTGIFNFSFGTYKIEVRDMADLGQLSIDDDFYGIAKEFALYPNFPNPFNPETRIRFQLAENSNVKLMIYDVLGRKVCTLVSDRMDAGHHIINWDGLDDKGIDAASGMYIYRIKAGDFIDHHKMLLIR